MSHNLLQAIGTRLEAQLHAKVSRHRSIEDTVKAQVETNPPAPFTLLSDGTKQFGYAASFGSGADTVQTAKSPVLLADEPEIVSDAGASFAALVSATAQIFSASSNEAAKPAVTPVVDTPAQVEEAVPEAVAEAMVTGALPVTTAATTSAPAVAAAVTELTVATTTTTATLTPVANPASTVAAAAAQNAPEAAATNAANAGSTSATESASTAARSLSSTASANTGWVMLANGTKQFAYAPTGGTPGVMVPAAKTPPVPVAFGEGATMRRKGSFTDVPITVTRVGDGVVFANFTDSEGTREMAFYPNQMDLVTAAP